jgi:hypothetical protein
MTQSFPLENTNKQFTLSCLQTLLNNFQSKLSNFDSLAVTKKLSMLKQELETLGLRFQDPVDFKASKALLIEQFKELDFQLTCYEWEQKLLSLQEKENFVDASIYLYRLNPSLKNQIKTHFHAILTIDTFNDSLPDQIKAPLVNYSVESTLEFGDCPQYFNLCKLNNALESWWHLYFTAYEQILRTGNSNDILGFNHKLVSLIISSRDTYTDSEFIS